MSVTSRGWLWELWRSWWLLLSLPFGLGSGPAFLYIGYRTKKFLWIIWGLGYSFIAVFIFTASVISWGILVNLGGFLFVLLLLSPLHAIYARREYLLRLAGEFDPERDSVKGRWRQFITTFREAFRESRRLRGMVPLSTELVASFPYELVKTTGDDAFDQWINLREQGRREGFVPVIIGGAADVEAVYNHYYEYCEAEIETTQSILEKADALDVETWFASQTTDHSSTIHSKQLPSVMGKTLPRFIIHPLMQGFGKKRKPIVYIAKIPASESWQIPAYLRLGGWNDCPPPFVQTAVSRYWKKRHGAEIIAVNGDLVEYKVAQPPQDWEEALRLAQEHAIYCSEICPNLEKMALQLMETNIWSFWWD